MGLITSFIINLRASTTSMIRFEYPGIKPPCGDKGPRDMTKVEAKQTFEWFVSQSQERREILIEAVRATGGDADRLDYTPSSLVTLWAWAMFNMQERKTTPSERAAFYANVKGPLRNFINYETTMTAGTHQVIMDIGFYLAEVFMRKYPQIKWALWTKKVGPYNKPYLTGFKLPFVPMDLVGACAGHTINGKRNPSMLKEYYDRWVQDLTEESLPLKSKEQPQKVIVESRGKDTRTAAKKCK